MERILIVLVVAAVTYLTRIAGFGLGNVRLPAALDRFLTFVQIAAFAALATPGVASGADELPARLLGAGAATLTVTRIHSLLPGLVAGMSVFWLATLAGIG